MPNLNTSQPIVVDEQFQDLSLLKFHPSGILNLSLNRLTDIYEGRVTIVDPGNPFMYLLETSSINTAFAIQECTLLTRKLHPRLANSETDLYLHMSDMDYLGRFGEPAYAEVMFNILFNDFKTNAHYNPVQNEYVLKLPRHLKLTIDSYIFTLTTAVIIRLTGDGVIDVKFENQDYNNLFPVGTNFINFNVLKMNQQETYLNFTLRLPEIDIETLEVPVERSKLFKNTLNYNQDRMFYTFRAYHMVDGKWVEMIVTHTDEVYDIQVPTCIVKVMQGENELEYYIPPVYINSGMVKSKVKFLVYTTKGPINVNFNDYTIGDFRSEYNDVFPDVELDEYTRPLQLISKVIYIKDSVVGGKSAMSFADLKRSVIENSIGDRKLPITTKQLEFESTQNNFKLIKEVDILNKRVFLLEAGIPNAATRYPISKFNLDILEFRSNLEDLVDGKNSVIKVNSNIVIIPEGTLFEQTNDGLSILTKIDHTQLVSMSGIDLTTEVNSRNYLSTFYHYILDTSDDRTELRAYDLSSPKILSINFKEFNPTARVGINTTNTTLTKTATGYTMDVLAKLEQYSAAINAVNITPYVVYTDNEDTRFYLEGHWAADIKGNPVYRFKFDTNYYVDANGLLHVTNFKDSNELQTTVTLGLTGKIDVIYVSNIIPINYVSSGMDNYIYNSYLVGDNCVVTLEEITFKFGDNLERLYRQSHTATGNNDYERYAEDVPARYESTVYGSDNTVLHTVNEIVYVSENVPAIKHHKGDVILNADGLPTVSGVNKLDRFINLMFIDYKAILSRKKLIADYALYLKSYLTKQITDNAVVIQNRLLENTEAFVVIPKNISRTRVRVPGRTTYIDSMQSFKLNVYVNNRVYTDLDTRNNIVAMITEVIDDYLYTRTLLSKTELLNVLYDKLKEFVSSIGIEKFTDLNVEYLELKDTNARISLRKLLQAEPDGYNLADDVSVTFVQI